MQKTYANDGDSFNAVGEAIRLIFGVSIGHFGRIASELLLY